MVIVKLYLLKSKYEQMYIYNNDNYINFTENSQNIYYDTMKLETYKFYLKHKILEKIFVKYIVINLFGEILYYKNIFNRIFIFMYYVYNIIINIYTNIYICYIK